MTAFQAHQGLASFINRLELEVNICRKEQPFEIKIPGTNDVLPDDIETTGPLVSSVENNGNVWKNVEEPSSAPIESNENPMMEEPLNSGENGVGVRWNQSEFSLPLPSQKSSRPANLSELPEQASASTSHDSQLDVSFFLIN